MNPNFSCGRLRIFALLILSVGLTLGVRPARAEAMLQLFNVNWDELVRKMPEIAEAGYTSLWLPPPAKAGSVYSVGYDLFDPFDLGDQNQRGTIRTRYGTKAELQQVVETAHRFGLRVYFDNIMNHRGFDVPGYNSSTPTNLYPGLVPADFHLQKNGSTYANWPSIGSGGQSEWGDLWKVQYQPLAGLIDLATEGGTTNGNFGATLGSSSTPKPVFVRQPGSLSYYMDTNLPPIAGLWRPFNGTNGDPVMEDVSSYLIRAALWTIAETKCDGFRFDAVKHVPSPFYGSTSANTDGYTGALQTMFDQVHGYGNNATGNGYVEGDNNRNSCFDTETRRNDALLFGEHLGQPPSFQEYIDRGMRLLGAPLHFHLNNTFGVGSLAGLEQRDPGAAVFSPINSVLFAQSHDDGYANRRELHNAYNFFREGLPSIYSDGYHQSSAPDYFPRVANAPYLGQFGDDKMPEVAYLHHQLARGGTRARWGDADIIAFERYDYRDPGSAADQTVMLFALNDNYSTQGDTAFLDGEGEVGGFPGGVNKPPGAAGDAQGLAVSVPPGSVLVQLATATAGYDRTYKKAIVRSATNSRATAQASGGSTVYVGSQTIPAGGGAIEILVPGGGYVAYGFQWPEASRANPATNAILFQQGGGEAPRITVYRTDGVNGDASGFNPVYPFRMRGSVNAYGDVIGGVHVSNLTYAIDVPVVTNANFDILVRSDSSAVNTLVKLDGGMDLNSQMGLGPLSGGVGPAGPDLRDHKPGAATDVFLGYEQAAFQFRDNPEKFAARNTLSNTIVSPGAETYYYTVGATNPLIVPGSGYGQGVGQTAAFVYHDPADAATVTNNAQASQRVPQHPAPNQPAEIYFKIGYQNYINTCFLYYTTNGTDPEGAFGQGQGSTQVIQALFTGHDNPAGNIDWWKVTLPGLPNGTGVRYKLGAFYGGSGGSVYAGNNAAPIADSEATGAKLYGITQMAITNFNPTTAVVWLHNNLNTNDTRTGLQPGFHIVRARTFLPRTNQSGVYNTFAQTFYYAGPLPAGAIAFPLAGSTITSSTYTVVVRADSTVTGVDFNIQDSNPANDDLVTLRANGNGTNASGQPIYVAASPVAANASISALYPNYPLEYRFVYTNIPTSGAATLNVRLKDFSSSVYTNRVTTLSTAVNTLAPAAVVRISSPATDGIVLTNAGSTTYLLQACFSVALSPRGTNFNLLINGVLQPQTDYFFLPYNNTTNGICPGYRTLQYNWNNPALGTNLIQVIYTNAVPPIADARLVIVSPPLVITGLANNNQLIIWDSAPGLNYQVYATTNLSQPFEAISGIIPGTGASTYYYDPYTAEQKFYRIQLVP